MNIASCAAPELDGINCRSCPVIDHSALARCPDDVVASLEAARAVRRLKRGSVLFTQGQEVDGLFALLDGAVTLSRRDACGKGVAIHLAVPGSTLGFRGLTDGGRHPVTASCSTNCVVCNIPRATIERALEASRDLEGVFFHHLADELAGAQDRMLQMATLGVRDRMILLLGRLATHFCEKVENGALRIFIPVSRIDMGSLTGMTPETVSRCIRLLQADNLAHFTRKHALIPSPGRFLDELDRLDSPHGEAARQALGVA